MLMSALLGAIDGEHENVVEWMVKKVPVGSVPLANRVMTAAGRAVDVRIVQLLHAWGLPVADGCFASARKGPSHEHVFEYVMANAGEISDEGWVRAAIEYDSPGREKAIRLVVEKYGRPIHDGFLRRRRSYHQVAL
jgi:hypothetical protein